MRRAGADALAPQPSSPSSLTLGSPSVLPGPKEGLGDTGPPVKREAHPILAASVGAIVLLLVVYALACADRRTDTPDAWFDISVYDFASQDHPTAFESRSWFWSIGIAMLGWHLLGVCYLLDDVAYADQAFMSASRPVDTDTDPDSVDLHCSPPWYIPSALIAQACWIVAVVLIVCHRDTLLAAVIVLSLGNLWAWHHLLHVYRDGTCTPSLTTYALYIVSFAALTAWMEAAAGFLFNVVWARDWSDAALNADESAGFLVWLGFKVTLLTAGISALYASAELAVWYSAVFVVTLSSYLESRPMTVLAADPSAQDAVGILLVIGITLNVTVAVWCLWRRTRDYRGGFLASFDNKRSRLVVHVLGWLRHQWQSRTSSSAPAAPSSSSTMMTAMTATRNAPDGNTSRPARVETSASIMDARYQRLDPSKLSGPLAATSSALASPQSRMRHVQQPVQASPGLARATQPTPARTKMT